MTEKELLDQNFDYIVDVRTPLENKLGHIKHAILFPLNKIHDLNLDKNAHIALYCRSGARSQDALQILKQKGYTHVENIGGIIDLKIPLVKD